LESKKVRVEREIASLKAIALSSNSATGRGLTTFSIFFDEMAHMIFGSGSTKSGEEIYDCLDPGTRILCADLVWRPIGELSVGDKLVGYDEEADKPGVGGRRRLRETEVLGLWHQKPQPTYRITFLDGSSVVCSGNHRWLRVNSVKGGGHNAPRWSAIDPRHEPGKRTTRPLRVGDHIKFLVEPWETDNTHDGGWLSGMIDGEGHMVANQGARRIGISQNEGPVLERLLNVLKDLGFEFTDNHVRPEGFYSGRNHLKPNHQVFVNRLEQCLRLLGQFRPTRLLSRHKEVWEGRTISNAQSVKTIESIERIEDRVLVDIETGTSTFVAEGLISHNSAEPSLDQFGTDRLIYIPSSPLTKIGKFFELYRHGTVLMKTEKPDGSSGLTRVDAKMLGLSDDDIEEGIEEAIAEPEMLIFQGPSWIAYQDWERSKSLGMPKFKRAVQIYDERMQRLEQRNPEKFKVERRGQFADVQGAYLNPDKVDAMFDQPAWRAPLAPQANGILLHQYRIHCDPGRCLVGDTYINTNQGMVKIVQVEVGDEVVTRDGTDSVVEWVPNGIKDVYKLTLRGGWEIRATGNHPVWTERGWVPLQKLRSNDKVQVRVGANLWPQNYVEIPDVRMPKRCNGRICFPTNTVDEKMGRLLGYIAAEGSIQETMLTITSHVDEKLVDEVASLIRDLFGIDPSWERIKGNARTAGWGNNHLMLILQALGFPLNEH
jgi:hypothetical protein